MSPPPKDGPVVGSDVPRQKAIATPDTVRVGCIAMVEKDGQPRRAEILSIRDTKSGRQFYCNFDNFNKRLDEWVPVSRIDFTKEIEWPNPEKDKPKEGKGKKGSSQPAKKTVPKKGQKRPSKREQSVTSEAATPRPWSDWAESQDQTPSAVNGEGQDASQVGTPRNGVPPVGPDGDVEMTGTNNFNREEEVEKLRTSGSMTQNPTEIARIRNINKVQFGLLSYRQYWSENIVEMLLEINEHGEGCTMEQISNSLAMTIKDVEHTLQFLRLLVYHRGQHKIVLPDKLIEQREKQKSKRRRFIDPSRIQWTPPVFTASAKTWGW
ncbi:hypothetical protein SAPIO_CDS9781 [Scedosporium apiospermum]|uniref:Histone acetyltransferase ESA1 n=1 Tax=Pseudallescheria apiosperma TaxID=563466 RepID=A0A084FXJ0_PSEDA|nr:uncharacterized protein SAPIO_CDS9781 [Scedosporium apiospermum]KEZ39802.1 hypothetical protein SAPIO_CDS9781 [Scedosporium apiospermum]